MEKVFEQKSAEELLETILSEEERANIEMRADLRRSQQQFKVDILNLEQNESETEYLQQRREEDLELVFSKADGEQEQFSGSAEGLSQKADKFIQKAKEKADLFPNLATNLYAHAAELKEAAGEDCQNLIKKIKEQSEKSADIAKKEPLAFLSDAIFLGIQKRYLEKSEMPGMEKIAKAILKDKQLLKDYALVLEENERQDFLNLIPEEKRIEISIAMDRAVSKVLNEKFIGSEEKKEQRNKVQERSTIELEKSISETDSKITVKMLAQTLRELGGDDSIRLLHKFGEKGLSNSKDKNIIKLRVSHTARILQELAEIDKNKASNLAMKFLAKKEIPQRLFSYFMAQLISNEFLTKKTSDYLDDKKNTPFLKQLIAQYPNQFNTVIDTISQMNNYPPAKNAEEIFQAIEDLESLTPIIFNRYCQADGNGKKELARQIKEIKPIFFRNTPIGKILQKKDQEILVEMVYLAYKPIGMSFKRVENLIKKISDRTEDLKEYIFPKNGYDFTLKGGKDFILRSDKTIDPEELKSYRKLFASEYPKTDEQVKNFSFLIKRLAKGGANFKQEELSETLSILNNDEMVRNFLNKYKNIQKDEQYNYLSEIKELIGIYFNDNYWERLSNFLSANPKTENEIRKILSDPERVKTIKKNLSDEAKNINWNVIDTREGISRLLSCFLSSKALKAQKIAIQRDSNKFQESKEQTTISKEHKNLKAYISKNIGSFFAKASAGICTAEDIALFSRDDHFHINIVENDDIVRGNIQAYIIKEDDKKSLVLRGFNPNINFLKKITPDVFCEKVLEIAKQFKIDNNFFKIYITESLSNWHALSNRPQVTSYLTKKYERKDRQKNYNLKIAHEQSVDKIYEV